jgi:uncharacterized protein YeaO (DUF488 family)
MTGPFSIFQCPAIYQGRGVVVFTVRIKRAYDPPSQDDGTRILVDRLWPRGLRKDDARIVLWLREIAPSDDLRKWFNHDPEKWGLFRKRFFAELGKQPDAIDEINKIARKGTVTLVYGAREELFNNAVAVKEYLETGRTASRRKAAA